MILRFRLVCALACAVTFAAGTLCVALGIDIPGDVAGVQVALLTRSASLTQLIHALTFIGSFVPALGITLVVTMIEVWRRKRLELGAAWALGAYLGAAACNVALRVAIGRLPPPVDYIPNAWPELHASFQHFSYPSGHAGTALIAYASLLVLVWPHRPWRWVALTVVVLIVGGVGFGRVYLGVHWPTDVAGGYLLAGIWLCGGLALRDHFSRCSPQTEKRHWRGIIPVLPRDAKVLQTAHGARKLNDIA